MHVLASRENLVTEVIMLLNRNNISLLICLLFLGASLCAIPNWDASPSRKYNQPNSVYRAYEPVRADSAHGFDVQKYVITLSVNDASHQINGNVLATVNATANLSSITYELRHLTVSNVLVNGSPAGFTHTGENLTIACNVASGQQFTTQVFYSGIPQLTSDAYHIGMIFGTNTVFTISDPDAGRNWWPCYDHPWDKAIVDLHITMRSDWKVAANGLRTGITNNNNGTSTTDWIGQHPMTTYLVCITAGPYVEINQTVPQQDNLPVQNFVMQSQYTNALSDLQRLPQMIAYFSQLFGAYPFEKYGNATVNMSTYGAMEHQTMTTLGNYIINGQGTYEPTIAHELAHQWYGDAVSFLTFKDVWLSEGFATYSEQLWTDYRFGWQSAVDYVASSYHSYYLGYENSQGPQTIYNPSFTNYFAPPSYEKAASVLHMLRLKIGNANFFQLLQQYFSTYCHGNAITSEFQALAEQISGQDLDQFFNQWIYGSGIPSVEYSLWNAADLDRTMLIARSTSPTATNFEVEIPFRFSFNGISDSLLVMATPAGHQNQFLYGSAGENYTVSANHNHWALLRELGERKPLLVECLPSNESVLLSWDVFEPSADSSYLIYRKPSSIQSWTLLTPNPIQNLNYLDDTATNGISYDYRLQVVANNGFLSAFSPVLSATPVAFSFMYKQLVVDETRDGTGANINPDDAMVDSFYTAAFAGLNGPLHFWDCATQGLPSLAELGNYKAVLWHADDFSQNLLQDNLNNLSGYLQGGGRLLLSGWKTVSILTPAFLERFAGDVNIVYDNNACLISAQPHIFDQLTPLIVDPAKTLPTWNGMLPYIYTFTGVEQSFYSAEMSAGSAGNGNSIAFHHEGPGRLILFGIPLYFMQFEQVHNALFILMPWLNPELPAEDDLTPVRQARLSAYPNPFNPSTKINLYQPVSGQAKVDVYNLKGQKVCSLLNSELPQGECKLSFNGLDSHGNPLASGIYLLRYQHPKGELKKKLSLLK